MSEESAVPQENLNTGNWNGYTYGHNLNVDCSVTFNDKVELYSIKNNQWNDYQARLIVEVIKAAQVTDKEHIKIALGVLPFPIDIPGIAVAVNNYLEDDCCAIRAQVQGVTHELTRDENGIWKRMSCLNILTRPFDITDMVNGT